MNVLWYAGQIIDELRRTVQGADGDAAEQAVNEILSAPRLFTAGAGRSLLMMRAFSMRLMHFGFTVHIVGDTLTPAVTDKDLLVIGSGSGETSHLIKAGEKASAIGTRIITLTGRPDSTLADLADITIKIPGALHASGQERTSFQPGGSSYEQALLILLESMILRIAELRNISCSGKLELHANLE